MELKINIYNDNDEVVKTYTKETYSIKMGFLKRIVKTLDIETIVSAFSGNTMEDNIELIKVASNFVCSSYDTIQELMKDIFKGLTNEEYENVSINEVANVLVNLVKYTVSTIGLAQSDEKN